jgi:hypothetical protein
MKSDWLFWMNVSAWVFVGIMEFFIFTFKSIIIWTLVAVLIMQLVTIRSLTRWQRRD